MQGSHRVSSIVQIIVIVIAQMLYAGNTDCRVNRWRTQLNLLLNANSLYFSQTVTYNRKNILIVKLTQLFLTELLINEVKNQR